MPEKTPQDRQKKDPKGHTFTHKGKSYLLPYPTEADAAKVPGAVSMDAFLSPDDEMKQIALGMHTLRVTAGADSPAFLALRELDTGEMVEIITEWLGESQGSSE